jgi:hypothetical protein
MLGRTCSCHESNLGRRAGSLIAIPTGLYWLKYLPSRLQKKTCRVSLQTNRRCQHRHFLTFSLTGAENGSTRGKTRRLGYRARIFNAAIQSALRRKCSSQQHKYEFPNLHYNHVLYNTYWSFPGLFYCCCAFSGSEGAYPSLLLTTQMSIKID